MPYHTIPPSHHITSHHITSHHITSHHITSQNVCGTHAKWHVSCASASGCFLCGIQARTASR
eukprot:4821390-Heterocapsa_arctica.AAC.1